MALKRLGLSRLSLRRSFAEVGGEGGGEQVQFSPADYAYLGANVALIAGDFSVGVKFKTARSGVVCTGARVVVPDGSAPQTVRVKLWRVGGAVQATSDATVLSSAGVHEVTFATPVALSNDYTLLAYRIDSATYTRFIAPAELPAVPIAGGAIVYLHLGFFTAGESASPGSDAIAERYPVTPMIEEA